MNERIKELAEQASLELFDDTAHHRLLKGFAEKFAELIVKECIGCIDIVGRVEWIGPPTYDLAIGACKLKVQQHFGVKE
jgi:hypothetical protein